MNDKDVWWILSRLGVDTDMVRKALPYWWCREYEQCDIGKEMLMAYVHWLDGVPQEILERAMNEDSRRCRRKRTQGQQT